MTYSRDGQTIKEFRVVRPSTKHMAGRAFLRALAGNAQRFLTALAQTMPFPVAHLTLAKTRSSRLDWRGLGPNRANPDSVNRP